jgi:hypothetical protein
MLPRHKKRHMIVPRIIVGYNSKVIIYIPIYVKVIASFPNKTKEMDKSGNT